MPHCCSANGVLQLEPMNSYNRLLLHRLADIFGYFYFSNHVIVDLPNVLDHFHGWLPDIYFFCLVDVLAHIFLTFVDDNVPSLRFSHESVGEGEDRHLVLERCPETSMYVKTTITPIFIFLTCYY